MKYLLYGLIIMSISGCDLVSTQTTTSNDNTDNTDESTDTVTHSIPDLSYEEKVSYLEAINVARRNNQHCGYEGDFSATTELQWSEELYHSSYEHSRDSAIHENTTHDGTGLASDWTAQDLNLGRGSTYKERMEHNGYTRWRHIAENIAGGTDLDTPEKVVQAWLDSPRHCKNLMNPDFKEVGMAYYKNSSTKYIHYWTQDFGRRQ